MFGETTILFLLSFLASVLQILYLPAISVYMSRLGYSASLVGFIGGFSSFIYALGAMVSSPVRGRLGDARTAASSLILLSAAYVLLPYIAGEALLLVVVAAGMLAYSFFWPAVEGSVRGAGGSVHWFSFSWSAGTLVGSAAAFLVVELDPAFLFNVFAVASAAMSVAAFHLEAGDNSEKEALSSSGARRLLGAWLAAFAYAASLGGMLVFYPLYVVRAGLSPIMVSILLFSIVGSRTFFFYVLKKFYVPFAAAPLLLCLGAAVPYTGGWGAAAVGALIGLGEAILYVEALDRVFSEGGKYTGLFEASIGLGYSAGPFIGSLFSYSLAAAVAAPAVLASTAAFISLFFRRKEGYNGVYP